MAERRVYTGMPFYFRGAGYDQAAQAAEYEKDGMVDIMAAGQMLHNKMSVVFDDEYRNTNSFVKEDGFSLYDPENLKILNELGYDPADFFGTWSRDELNYKIGRAAKMRRARKVLDRNGMWGVVSGVAGGMLDPTILATIPFGGAVMGAKLTTTIMREMMLAGGTEVISELALHSQQPERTLQESIGNVGMVAMFSGGLSGGVQMYLNRGARRTDALRKQFGDESFGGYAPRTNSIGPYGDTLGDPVHLSNRQSYTYGKNAKVADNIPDELDRAVEINKGNRGADQSFPMLNKSGQNPPHTLLAAKLRGALGLEKGGFGKIYKDAKSAQQAAGQMQNYQRDNKFVVVTHADGTASIKRISTIEPLRKSHGAVAEYRSRGMAEAAIKRLKTQRQKYDGIIKKKNKNGDDVYIPVKGKKEEIATANKHPEAIIFPAHRDRLALEAKLKSLSPAERTLLTERLTQFHNMAVTRKVADTLVKGSLGKLVARIPGHELDDMVKAVAKDLETPPAISPKPISETIEEMNSTPTIQKADGTVVGVPQGFKTETGAAGAQFVHPTESSLVDAAASVEARQQSLIDNEIVNDTVLSKINLKVTAGEGINVGDKNIGQFALNPKLSLLKSPFQASRQIIQKIASVEVMLRKEQRGVAKPVPLETKVKKRADAAFGAVMHKKETLYAAYAKRTRGTEERVLNGYEFGETAIWAARKRENSGIPEIDELVRFVEDNLSAPMRNNLLKYGLLRPAKADIKSAWKDYRKRLATENLAARDVDGPEIKNWFHLYRENNNLDHVPPEYHNFVKKLRPRDVDLRAVLKDLKAKYPDAADIKFKELKDAYDSFFIHGSTLPELKPYFDAMKPLDEDLIELAAKAEKRLVSRKTKKTDDEFVDPNIKQTEKEIAAEAADRERYMDYDEFENWVYTTAERDASETLAPIKLKNGETRWEPIEEVRQAARLNVVGAKGYVTRIWKFDKVMSRTPELEAHLVNFLTSAEIRAKYGYKADEALTIKQATIYAQQVTKTLAGWARHGQFNTKNIVLKSGPLKGKVIDIPDEYLDDWIISDFEEIFRQTARYMSAEIEQARGGYNLESLIGYINREADQRVSEIKLGEKGAMAQVEYLQKRRIRDIADTTHTYKQAMQQPVHERTNPQLEDIGGGFRNLNFTRSMHNVVLSSMPDIGRVISMSDAFITPFKALGIRFNPQLRAMVDKDLRVVGGATEIWMNSRIASTIGDEVAQTKNGVGMFRQITGRMAHVAGRMFGINRWNHEWKGIASMVAQHDRIVSVKEAAGFIREAELLTAKNAPIPNQLQKNLNVLQADLASKGISWEHIPAINRALTDDARMVGDVWTVDTSRWHDSLQYDEWSSGILRDTDAAIVTPGVGDKPKIATGPIGQLLFQFRGHTLGSHNKMIMPMAQNPWKVNNLVGITVMLEMGWMSQAIKHYVAGRGSDWEAMETQDHLKLAYESSGLGGLFADIFNVGDKMVGGKMSEQMGLTSISPRFRGRSVMETVLGPTFGFGTDLLDAAYSITGNREFKQSDLHRISKLLPFVHVAYLRQITDALEISAGKGMGLEQNTSLDPYLLR